MYGSDAIKQKAWNGLWYIVYNLVFRAGALTNMLYVDLFVQSQVIKVIYL